MECEVCDVNAAQEFYITSTSAPADDRPRVLKHGDLFAVFNRNGGIESFGLGEEGLFYEGTRFLSELVLYLGNSRPLLLTSTISGDNFLFSADLTNVDILDDDEVAIPRGTLHLHRSKFLWNGIYYDKFRIANYGLSPVSVPFRLHFDADFADIFEVRGARRENRGQRLEDASETDSVALSYKGLDGVIRRSHLRCTPTPKRISPSEIVLRAALQPKEEVTFHLTVSCMSSAEGSTSLDPAIDWETAGSPAKNELKPKAPSNWRLSISSGDFNKWVTRSAADVQMMLQGNPEVDYPYAGVPWFSTVFGIDGIITALECLWLTPSIAKGVLRYLASTQATKVYVGSDAAAGKVLHEIRRAQMPTPTVAPFPL